VSAEHLSIVDVEDDISGHQYARRQAAGHDLNDVGSNQRLHPLAGHDLGRHVVDPDA